MKQQSVGGSALHEGGEPLGQSGPKLRHPVCSGAPASCWMVELRMQEINIQTVKQFSKQYENTSWNYEIVKCRGAGPWSMCVSKAPAPLTCCGAPASSWMVELRMHGHEHKNKSNELYHRGRPASFDGRPPCDSELGLCDSQHPAMLGVAKV